MDSIKLTTVFGTLFEHYVNIWPLWRVGFHGESPKHGKERNVLSALPSRQWVDALLRHF